MSERQSGMLVPYEQSGTRPVIRDEVAIHVYRVLQEALNNIARHSKSERAWVRVQFSSTSLLLEVEDRGVGISVDAPKNGLSPGRRGIGMVGMRERAELLHAELEFARPATGGAVVRLNVPLAEEVAHEQ